MEIIRINENDNVAVAVRAMKKGTEIEVDGRKIKVLQRIPAGHKVAISRISDASPVIKYGYPIGNAYGNIEPGEWVHTHNLKTALSGLVDYNYEPVHSRRHHDDVVPLQYEGFERADGSTGTRNEIWIVPTVGCVNGIARELEKRASHLVKGSIEAVAAFAHPYGCSQLGEDQENTRKILADIVNHPNAGGVLVLGLGCENTGIEILKEYIGEYDENRVKFLKCQDTENELEDGIKLLEELAEYASKFERKKISASKLIVGLKCGGSDGFSGITANPLVGRFSDLLVEQGGTTILTEVPEMFGAETILMNRAKDEETFDKTVSLVNNFKCYYEAAGQPIYENPSPGNKDGGISTLEDKSLGCTQKSGTSDVNGVLEYGDRVKESGLNLLSAPGNDLVASTALAASGAQIILFTTGRGTPFASPVPTIKISSNTPLADRKSNWIDFNAGPIAEDKTIDDLARLLLAYVLEVASGKKVKSEIYGYRDMAIFKKGVTL
ncbi:MAG: altronate dehydratase [Oscillospiraceae bacterium]|nr:altronate dehydratase [Oscillospiraceae bacterium]